ncbi:MAG: FAD-binding protein [Alphaproteobacteria bacterium]|nr:FAD-binding protein [Alphaproteobacteria bacterium]
MLLPQADPSILARRDEIIARLKQVLPPGALVIEDSGLAAFDGDALTAYRQKPLAVAIPDRIEQVQAVMRLAGALGVNVVPRGAGTSLSGGALPLADGILLSLAKFNRVKAIDYANRCAVVEPGVTNLAITRAVEGRGFYYAPDPSSQVACTIGGNVAENSGGVHCLKYGLTTNNLLGLEAVLMSGALIRLGGRHLDSGGFDLLGLMTGSEGLLGVITEVTVRILPKPEAVGAALIGFESIAAAGRCVAEIIASGLIPAGLEMMDRRAVAAVEAYCAPGYPKDCDAVLFAEIDGPASDVAIGLKQLEAIAKAMGALSFRMALEEAERQALWAGRKAAFAAMGRIAPDMLCMDGTIPRRALPRVLDQMAVLARDYGLAFANVFHAGDGNLHPLILFDVMKPGDLEKAEAFGDDILKLCVESGGVLTGEHGVGVEKRHLLGLQFSEAELLQQQRLKCAFDPDGRLNPGKMFPSLHRCAELGRMHVHEGRMRFPDLPRL